MARYKNRPPCPNCGGTKQRSYTSGLANEGDYPVAVVKCLDCGYIGHQVLAWLPEGTSINRLDGMRRLHNRLTRRMRMLRAGKPIRKSNPERLTSDTLIVTVQIVKGKISDRLAASYPGLTAKRSTVIVEEVA